MICKLLFLFSQRQPIESLRDLMKISSSHCYWMQLRFCKDSFFRWSNPFYLSHTYYPISFLNVVETARLISYSQQVLRFTSALKVFPSDLLEYGVSLPLVWASALSGLVHEVLSFLIFSCSLSKPFSWCNFLPFVMLFLHLKPCLNIVLKSPCLSFSKECLIASDHYFVTYALSNRLIFISLHLPPS